MKLHNIKQLALHFVVWHSNTYVYLRGFKQLEGNFQRVQNALSIRTWGKKHETLGIYLCNFYFYDSSQLPRTNLLYSKAGNPNSGPQGPMSNLELNLEHSMLNVTADSNDCITSFACLQQLQKPVSHPFIFKFYVTKTSTIFYKMSKLKSLLTKDDVRKYLVSCWVLNSI